MKNIYVALLIILITSVQAQNKKNNLVIGTYTNSCDSKGIYVYDFDSETADFNFKNSTEIGSKEVAGDRSLNRIEFSIP